MNITFRSGHVPALDGLRGCAILLVLAFHCLQGFGGKLGELASLGWVGVDLFFVLSGFLITGVLLDAKGKQHYFSTFYARRVLRIFPLYYLTLGLVYLATSIPALSPWNPQLNPAGLQPMGCYLTYTHNLYVAWKGWEASALLHHFWSLAIEEQFYLFWPMGVYLLSKRGLLRGCGGLMLLSLLVRNAWPSYPFSFVFPLARLDALALGAGTAVLLRQCPRHLNRLVLPLGSGSVMLVLLCVFVEQDSSPANPWLIRFGYSLVALAFASLLAATFDRGWLGAGLRGLLTLPALRWLGRYSYGMYVFHWWLYQGFYLPLARDWALPPAAVLPFIGGVLLLSVLSYHLLERPFLRFKAYFHADTDWAEVWGSLGRRGS